MRAHRLIPKWLRNYRRQWLPSDITAALVSGMLLVPQGLAYALLAGLPPYVGLYASLVPLIAYAVFGSSSAMSVGPAAVLSLMTVSALSPIAVMGSPEYIGAAIVLTLLSGLFLFTMGLFKLGTLSNLLSHPVISGFVSGAAALIIVGQLPALLGIEADGKTASVKLVHVIEHLPDAHLPTMIFGVATALLLIFSRIWLPMLLFRLGTPKQFARLAARLMPMLLVLCSIALVHWLRLGDKLDIVGEIPSGLPEVVIPEWNGALVYRLLLPALIIALLTFVESLSIAQAVAARRGERLNADGELLGLGAANVTSALSGGLPVAGSFSRTAVNAEAGAASPLAGVLAALVMVPVLLFLTGMFSELPLTVLAAIIIVAAASLFDFRGFIHNWRYDRTDGIAMSCTFAGVLLFGVEAGIALGIGLSFATLIWRSSRPHIAVVGRVPGTEHFRNVLRHDVETHNDILFLRIDESLFFSNISAVEDRLLSELKRHPATRELVLILSSVSRIDGTALERLQQINKDLQSRSIRLHLSEVKGPVLDRLSRSKLLEKLTGRIFLSSYIAELALQQGEEDPPPEQEPA
ncbi:SulP family inorganic anion transporter [Microbulbifer hydrolyticus]|uniref:Sulfate permease n=1 Tax=Microbulbifer hydrolyticus TaxID=48074 RepID=A0A6P1TA46_9GAMM|nr:sulfate permease [Microbulbifer hydrolyticus]MBB5210663.1 SulP family sulfate permease [Microbulbifer hydrolyticus]QHQ38877.1 sulfate permease [Microbulbifer hydrolyticus]